MIWFEINQYYNSWSCLWLFASYKRVFSFFLPLLFCVARLVPSLSYEQNDLILLKQETTEDSFFTFGRSRKFCYESLWLKTDTKVKEFQKLKAKDRNASALVETFRFSGRFLCGSAAGARRQMVVIKSQFLGLLGIKHRQRKPKGKE